MIHEQALRKGSARAFYATQIDQMGERLDIVESALSRARREQSASSAQSQARKAKIKSLKGQTVEAIMDLIENDPSQFNQLLSVLIKRITYIRDGDPDLTIEV
jgi:archaellum component FlaC